MRKEEIKMQNVHIINPTRISNTSCSLINLTETLASHCILMT